MKSKKRALGTDELDVEFGKHLLSFPDDAMSNSIPEDPDPNLTVPSIHVRFVECPWTRSRFPHNLGKICIILYRNIRVIDIPRLALNIGGGHPSQKHAVLTYLRIIFKPRALSTQKQARIACGV